MQTVKIQTGYSDKSSQNYNSNQYSVSLEMECHINGTTHEIEDAAAKLFGLCRKIVANEKSAKAPQQAPLRMNQPDGNDLPSASSRQIGAIMAIGRSIGLDKSQLEEFAGTTISSTCLSSKAASRIIESLKKKQAA